MADAPGITAPLITAPLITARLIAQVEASFRRRKVMAFAIPALILAYLLYAAISFDILGVAAIVGVQSVDYNKLFPGAGESLPGE